VYIPPPRTPVAAALVATLLAGTTPALAHHGRDFLLVQTAEKPHAGSLFLVPRQDWVDSDEGSDLELEPALLWGVTGRLALEVHAHAAKASGGDLEYESTAPALQLRLTPEEASWGLALSVEYEIARGAGDPGTDEDGVASHSEGFALLRTRHESEGHGEATGDRLEARLALSHQWIAGRLAFNLVAADPEHGDAEWGYAAGYRYDSLGRWAAGIEVEGSLDGDRDAEILAALYLTASERLQVNLGVGTGLGPGAPDFTLRTSLVLGLR